MSKMGEWMEGSVEREAGAKSHGTLKRHNEAFYLWKTIEGK